MSTDSAGTGRSNSGRPARRWPPPGCNAVPMNLCRNEKKSWWILIVCLSTGIIHSRGRLPLLTMLKWTTAIIYAPFMSSSPRMRFQEHDLRTKLPNYRLGGSVRSDKETYDQNKQQANGLISRTARDLPVPQSIMTANPWGILPPPSHVYIKLVRAPCDSTELKAHIVRTSI